MVREVRLYKDEEGRRIETLSDLKTQEIVGFSIVFETLAMLNTAFGPVISLTDERIPLPMATNLEEAFAAHDKVLLQHHEDAKKEFEKPKLVVSNDDRLLK